MCGYFSFKFSVRQIFPTNRHDFSHKPTGFFHQTDLIFSTNRHDFSHKLTWFCNKSTWKKCTHQFLILWPYTHQATPALTSRPLQHMPLRWELRQYNFKVLWRTEYYKETFYSFLWKLGTDLAPKMAEADRNRPFWYNVVRIWSFSYDGRVRHKSFC